MDLNLISLVLVLALFVTLVSLRRKIASNRSSKLNPPPPGPWGIPFVGFLLHSLIGGESYQRKLLAVKQKYGKVATVRMGSFKCIWLNDIQLVKEAFSNPVFCGRPKIHGITSRTNGFVGGLIFNDGADYKEQRRFVVKHLKDLGLTEAGSMECIIMEEIQELTAQLQNNCVTPISTRHLFNVPIMNVLWTIITGDKFKHDDPKLIELVDTLNRSMELNGTEKAAFFMPWLTYICPSLIGWKSYVADATFIFNFWRDYSKSKLKLYNAESSPQFFVDHYVKAMKDCKDPKSSFYGTRGELSLAASIQDLFIAGTETTATTLSWAFLYLAVFPAIQEKIFAEVDRVVGQSLPNLTCRLRMPYTEAFILEVMRHGTLAPLGIVHRAAADSHLGGYFIPKDSIIQPNISAIHNDPDLWVNPQQFDPDRFLDLDSPHPRLLKKDNFLPFSYGGRHCIGETLAKQELFLFITSIVQKFRISCDPAKPSPSLVPLVGVGSIPQAHKIWFTCRNS